MADEWDEAGSTGKSFGRGNYVGDTETSSNVFNKADDDGGWDDNNTETTSCDNNRNGYRGNDNFRGRGRGGRGGGGGFGGRRDDGDRRDGGGYKRDGGDRRDGFRRDAHRSNGDSEQFDDDNENGFENRDSRRGNRNGRGGGGRGRDGGGGNDRDNFGGGGGGRRKNDEERGDGDKATEKPREFYIPPEPTDNEDEIFNSGISSGINFNKYDKIPIKVTDGAPPAINSFQESGLKPFILENVRKSGYTVPTPIQKNAIPIIMAKRDLMACAQTGSGKTAAFLLPIIHDLLVDNQDLSIGKPHVLIVSPTRELSIQIFNEARKFALSSYLKTSIVYGGTAVKHQGDNIAKGCHILVATPGRLLDFVDKGFISFEDTRFIVLDEADRMLDMGFMSSVEKIMNHPTIRPMTDRQTLMFSATFPEEIQRLAGQFLNNYVFLAIGIVGGACADVEQHFYQVSRFEKRTKLIDILNESEPSGTMVFVETQRNADFLASLLSENKFRTTSIHGARLQREREQALRDFTSGKMAVLIATSVAARGLDLKNVVHVINYDLPKSIDDYVHRIGRTGRVGNCGKATSFFDPEHDAELGAHLVKILEQADMPIPDFLSGNGGGRSGGYGGGKGGNKFGGRDVRNQKLEVDNFGARATQEPDALEPEEDW